MGVYIKGLEMPKSCYYCPFTVLKNGRRAYCPFCHAEYSNPSNEPDGRLANCPLIPIPPHGRLIDADALTKMCQEMQRIEWNNKAYPYSWAYAYESFEGGIDNAPTIIPAEEGE